MTPAIKDSATRDRILEAGAKAVSEKSFSGCGLSEILQAAGVPKGSFYHYFASKEDFGIALIERARDEFLDEVRPILSDRKKKPLERLRAVFDRGRQECCDRGAARQCLIPRLALETAQLSEPVHAAVRGAYGQWTALLAQVIREAQASAEIARRHDADRLARLLVMLWEGATLRMQIDRSFEPLDEFFACVFDSKLLSDES